MSEQLLRWTPDAGAFTMTDSHGRSIRVMDGDESEAAKPSDLLPISLAACTGYTLVGILRKQRQDLRALEATIETTQDPDPPWRFRRIAVRFVARGVVDSTKAQKALKRAEEKYCSVSATLRDVVELRFDIAVELETV